jgi:hypothetical protein
MARGFRSDLCRIHLTRRDTYNIIVQERDMSAFGVEIYPSWL